MRKTRTREAVNRNDSDFTKAEREEMNSSLKSLILPWAMLVLFAIAATVYSVSDSDFLSLPSSILPEDAASSWIPSSFSSRSRSLVEDGSAKVLHLDHDPLFPLDVSDYIGFTCAIVGLMIAAGGGIGGGGILVPIYILVMGFSPKHAIPLSNITVLGGAFANTILNTRKRHPLADRPLVDWDLILVMEPLTIAGALIGALLNKLLPETLLVVMLVLLLSFTAYKSLKKATKMYKIETRKMKEKESELTRIIHKEDEDDEDEAEEALLDNMELQEGESPGETTSSSDDDEKMRDVNMETLAEIKKQEDLTQILEEERETPSGNIAMLVTMFVVVLFINLMKGGGAFHSPLGIRCGSKSFWIANITMLLWILFISGLARQYLVNRYHRKKACGYKYVEGDIVWDEGATVKYPIICMAAGFFAGMFGVGGGIVKGPLMLAMGVHPAVSSASSACMILFTSFTATTSFVVFGLLIPDYAPVCFCIGFLATLVGQIGLGYLMKKSNRNSYIAFSIGAVVLLSAFLMTIQSLVSMAEAKHHSSGGICGKED